MLGHLTVYTDCSQEALLGFDHVIRLSPLALLNLKNYVGLGRLVIHWCNLLSLQHPLSVL